MSSAPKSNQAPPAPFKFEPDFFHEFTHPEGCSGHEIAKAVNEAIEARTAKWVKVYSRADDGISAWWPQNPGREVTVYSYLTPPQLIEVEPCKHEIINYAPVPFPMAGFGECTKCGVKMVQQWSPVTKGGANG